MSNTRKWNSAMTTFLGVDPSAPVCLISLIFCLRVVFAPINVILGSLAEDGSCPDHPDLPTALLVAGLLEVVLVPLVFYIHVYLPYRQLRGLSPADGRSSPLSLVLASLSLALVVVIVVTQVLVSTVDRDDRCPDYIFYTTWVWLALKYIDIVIFGICLVVHFCIRK